MSGKIELNRPVDRSAQLFVSESRGPRRIDSAPCRVGPIAEISRQFRDHSVSLFATGIDEPLAPVQTICLDLVA